MALTKISLFEMAEAVGDVAQSHRGHVERWDRDHSDDPLSPDDQWVIRARTFETAHLTLALMALDEAASRKFVATLTATAEGKMLIAMLAAAQAKGPAVEAKADEPKAESEAEPVEAAA